LDWVTREVEEPVPTGGGTDSQLLTKNTADIICHGGLGRLLQNISHSSLRILDRSPEEMTVKPVDEFTLAEDFPILADAIARNLSDGRSTGSVILRMRKKDGATTWMENSARILRDSETGSRRNSL
jgi:hypothetical protein